MFYYCEIEAFIGFGRSEVMVLLANGNGGSHSPTVWKSVGGMIGERIGHFYNFKKI